MKTGQQQKKTYRFKMDWVDEEGITQTKKYYNYDGIRCDTGIPRASFFKMSRGVFVPKWQQYKITPIRDLAYQMVRVQLD